MRNTILEVENLSKYRKGKEILKNINFKVFEGEIVGLIGSNGAGKTTLMKALVGLSQPDKGEIKIFEKNNKKYLKDNLSKIGVMIESPAFYPQLTGWKNLKQQLRSYNKKDTDYLMNLIEKFSLSDSIDKKAKNYSLGMKQKLGLLQVMIKEPSLFILDEPTNGLDPQGVSEIRNELLHLANNKKSTILIASHSLSELEQICDRIYAIHEGMLIETEFISKNEDNAEIELKMNVTDAFQAKEILEMFSVNVISEKEIIISKIIEKDISTIMQIIFSNKMTIYDMKILEHSLEKMYFDITQEKKGEKQVEHIH
ncbi:ABC transporter ATP-binding protein [Exiguobacterium acetylicum]|uniref:ABC transporter ATP-binding protein n=1 Tax=Exiguobacterium acetylicum TaxID=41170 RepID=UPI001CA734AB|nr:ABC transporter ATP-binding protein [Exiguobacterium acetylicum]QZY88644.1 ABC transporter ATP-binding protein [Exiguobacterium acetylicum]